MVIAGQNYIVKDMSEVGAFMDFSPSLYSLALANYDLKMLNTLANIDYPEWINELSRINNYSCNFYNIIKDENNPIDIAVFFLNSNWLVSEQFQ
jgi:hypothetical protein